MPYHLSLLEGVSLDRTDQGRKPRFLKVEVPTDTVNSANSLKYWLWVARFFVFFLRYSMGL